jgi:hypothetical protein
MKELNKWRLNIIDIMKELKLYHYVGSEEIKSSVANFQTGTVIRSISDLKSWINNIYNKEISSSNLIVATFVIDRYGNLRLAERHSEHIACAGGQPVLSAGEIFISWNKNCFEVSDITNQSTGYCPEVESWKYVEIVLNRIGIDRPSHFTAKFTFRHCSSCSQINIVKNSLFICLVCNSPLSDRWNF